MDLTISPLLPSVSAHGSAVTGGRPGDKASGIKCATTSGVTASVTGHVSAVRLGYDVGTAHTGTVVTVAGNGSPKVNLLLSSLIRHEKNDLCSDGVPITHHTLANTGLPPLTTVMLRSVVKHGRSAVPVPSAAGSSTITANPVPR